MRCRVAVLAVLALVVGTGAAASGDPRAGSAAAAKPTIKKRLIPYPKKRKREMAAYSKRHYGQLQVAAGRPEADRHPLRRGRQRRLDLQHLRPRTGRTSSSASCPASAPTSRSPPAAGSSSSSRATIRCRHVVGLNHVSIGIEHAGFSDGDVLDRQPQLNASLQLTQWLRCRFGIPVKGVIGHNESLSSPYYMELDPDFRGRTHGDFNRASMDDLPPQAAEARRC